MAKKQTTSRYIPLAAIRRFARRIAERFQPDKIILFGSYAYGKPHEESDVDLLVIMPTKNAIDQSIRIKTAFERLFSLDLIVRTPWQIERGLKDDNWFLREITEKGKVLYEAADRQVGPQSRMIASKRQMEAALRHVDQIRLKCRGKLDLSPS